VGAKGDSSILFRYGEEEGGLKGGRRTKSI